MSKNIYHKIINVTNMMYVLVSEQTNIWRVRHVLNKRMITNRAKIKGDIQDSLKGSNYVF